MGKAGEADEVPPIWEWLAQQHNNTDPVRAEAARYIVGRWQLGPWYNHRKVLSTLQSEDSDHLHGTRLLTQDFVEFFGIEPRDQVREHNLGVVSPLIPVGREQCTHRYRSQKQCTRDAIPGTNLCGNHGGSWITDDERAEVVQKVSAKLVDISERAVVVLADLLDNAKSEKVRYDAAVAILDRVGVGPIQKLELSVTPEAERVASEVRSRILELKRRNEDTVEGEVVSDSDDEGQASGA